MQNTQVHNTTSNLNTFNMHHPDLKSYLTDIDFLEAPLVGLCAKPLHTMPENELRDWVQQQRLNRENRATFKARISAEVVEKKDEGKPKIDVFAQFS